jgi:hypothetical protein
MNPACWLPSNFCSVYATVKEGTRCWGYPTSVSSQRPWYITVSLLARSYTIERLMSFAEAIVGCIKTRILEKIYAKNNFCRVAQGWAWFYWFKYSTSFFRKYSFGSSVGC